MNQWSLTYTENKTNKKIIQTTQSKIFIIEKYLNLLFSFNDISELKIFKNNKDYTPTLNKFLAK